MSKEFVDARRRVHTLQNAPQVLFRSDPPLELQGVPGLKSTSENDISYITFGISIQRGKEFKCIKATDEGYQFFSHAT